MRRSAILLSLIVLGQALQAGPAFSAETARICSADSNQSQFLKVFGYSDRSFRVEECSFGGIDNLHCADIKGYSRNGILAHGNAAATLPSILSPAYDRRGAKMELLAALKGDVRTLRKLADSYPSVKYVERVLHGKANQLECEIYPGDFTVFVDQLRKELGTLQMRENAEAKADFLAKVREVEVEKNSKDPRSANGGPLWYTRTKGGKWDGNGYFLLKSLMKQPAETPLSESEGFAAQDAGK